VNTVMEAAANDALEVDSPYLPSRRRLLGGRIVTSCLLLSLGLVAWAAESRYHVVPFLARHPIVPSQVDPRVESFLADGRRALAEGNLENAQGDFDRASVLAERDPRVLLDEALVAAAKADVPWLKLRLLAPDASVDARVTTAELNERVAIARKTADDALNAAPQDPQALRAKLDALRLAGDRAAWGYVVAVFAHASQPETAYSLAALDLLEPVSPWATVVDRLRLATGAEGGAGRARAALVYALAKSGDVTGAKTELAKLDAQTRPYPLLPDLHAWAPLDRAVAAPAPIAEPLAPAPVQKRAGAAGPLQRKASGAPPIRVAAPARSNAANSPLQSAADEIHRGDLDRAERIYQDILGKNPSESQSLTGLGNILRLRGNLSGAIEAYQHALNVNPSYMPAVLGIADTQWTRGDHAGAAKWYRRIVDRLPGGMVPDYVNSRAAP
jgi:hypothetical protein